MGVLYNFSQENTQSEPDKTATNNLAVPSVVQQTVSQPATATTTSTTTTTTTPKKAERTFICNTGIPSNKALETIVKFPQKKLKEFLVKYLKNKGYQPIVGDGYIFAIGDIPILLTSHMDTVHDYPPYIITEEKTKEGLTKVSSPFGIGGDDRCGVYIIMDIINTYKPYILFCEDEESGGVGSNKFMKTVYADELKSLKYMIELDRKNGMDAVFYQCDNPEFTKYITDNTGFKTAWGSFSDIGHLAPPSKVAAVNLSCGYYNAHTKDEYILLEEMYNTGNVVKDLLDKADEAPVFEYIEKKYTYTGNYRSSYGYGYGYDYGYDDYDYDYDYYYSKRRYGYYSKEHYDACQNNTTDTTTSTSATTNNVKETENVASAKAKETAQGVYLYVEPEIYLEIYYMDINDKEEVDYAEGITEAEAWGNFFREHPNTCANDVYDYYFVES